IRIDHSPELAIQELAQVCTEIDRDALRQCAVPAHPDSQTLADSAVRTIGCDQVLSAHSLCLARVAMANDRCNTILILLERDALGRKEDSRTGALGAFLKGWLECVLRQKYPYRRAQVPDAIVEIGDVVRGRTASECFDTHHARVLHELSFRLGADDLLDADAAEDLHRAL